MFAVTLIFSWKVNRAHELEEMHKDLLTRTEALISLTDQEHGVIKIDFADEIMSEYSSPIEPYYFQIRAWAGSAGEILESSKSLAGENLPLPNSINVKPQYSRNVLKNGREIMLLTMWFTPRYEDNSFSDINGKKSMIALASGMEEFDRFTKLFLLTYALPMELLFIALLVGIYYLIRKSLLPLAVLAKNVESIDVNNIGTVINLDYSPAEVQPLVVRLNEMQIRIKNAMEHERRFSSDVAHELRTPVAELRLACEVNIRDKLQKTSKPIYEEMLGSINGMENIIETVLSIARLDANTENIQAEECELSKLISKIVKRYQNTMDKRHVTTDTNLAPLANIVRTDYRKLELILSNLIGNCTTHAPEKSQYIIHAEKNNNGMVCLNISNFAPELSQEDLPLLFECFWQKDSARTNHAGAGLGLAFAKTLCDYLGFAIEAKLDSEHIVTISIKNIPTSLI